MTKYILGKYEIHIEIIKYPLDSTENELKEKLLYIINREIEIRRL